MGTTQVETYGKLLLSQLFTHIWYGHWDKYEETIRQLPTEMAHQLPFHPFYELRKVKLSHKIFFVRHGESFIPPYVSSYYGKSEEEQQSARQNLLFLIGAYEKFDYYYPVENDELPDHFGSITGFMTVLLQEEIKAYNKNDQKLIAEIKELQREIYDDYLQIALEKMAHHYTRKIDDSFFQQFLPYYKKTMKVIVHS